ncbi:UNVERIFIED_ORG: hypothetical protein ABIC97_003960 [Peribacillus simplex]
MKKKKRIQRQKNNIMMRFLETRWLWVPKYTYRHLVKVTYTRSYMYINCIFEGSTIEANHYQYIKVQIEYYSSKPLREAIFYVVKNAIIEGVFLPGDRLTKDDIAQQFNCSRTPVREGLRKLEQENIQGYGQKILPSHYP